MKGNVIVGQSGGPNCSHQFEPRRSIPHGQGPRSQKSIRDARTESRDCCRKDI